MINTNAFIFLLMHSNRIGHNDVTFVLEHQNKIIKFTTIHLKKCQLQKISLNSVLQFHSIRTDRLNVIYISHTD